MSVQSFLKKKISSLHVDLAFFEDILEIPKGMLLKDKWDSETLKRVYEMLHNVFDMKLPNWQDMAME